MQIIDIREIKKTRFDYRGVTVEVKHPVTSASGHTDCWCYYLNLSLAQFLDPKLGKRLWIKAKSKSEGSRKDCGYMGDNLLNNLAFHGGITFYRKSFSFDDSKWIEIGCDYAHLYDDERQYTLEDVICDAKRTVDSLHELATYLIHCIEDGRFVAESHCKRLVSDGCKGCAVQDSRSLNNA